MNLNRDKSPMSAIVGYALLLNLITGPLLTILFYGTTLDEQVFKFCRSNLAKNLWRIVSLATCWIVLVAEEVFPIYQRFKLSEKVRKMLKRPSIFRRFGRFDKLTKNRRSLLKNYYSMIEKDIDRLNNLCARESSIQLVLQSGSETDVLTFLSKFFLLKLRKILSNQS